MMPCFNKQLFGIDCPGCGIQRAFIELLKGNFFSSIRTYPALIPTLALLLLLFLHLIFKFRHGAFYLKISFIFTVSIIIINYFYKLFNHLLI